MSGFASKLQMGSILQPIRLCGSAALPHHRRRIVLVAAAIIFVSVSGSSSPLTSQVTRLPPVNPLPGGLQSNPSRTSSLLRPIRSRRSRRRVAVCPIRRPSPPASRLCHADGAPGRSGGVGSRRTTGTTAGTQPLPTPAAQPLRYTPDPMVHRSRKPPRSIRRNSRLMGTR